MKSNATEKALGHPDSEGRRQIAVRISDAAFAELKARALQANRSIAEQLREYIEVGLEVDRDWDDDRHPQR